jgi:hypothetical protein
MHPIDFCPTFSICSANLIFLDASGGSEKEATGSGLGNQQGANPGGSVSLYQLLDHAFSLEFLKKLVP